MPKSCQQCRRHGLRRDCAEYNERHEYTPKEIQSEHARAIENIAETIEEITARIRAALANAQI